MARQSLLEQYKAPSGEDYPKRRSLLSEYEVPTALERRSLLNEYSTPDELVASVERAKTNYPSAYEMTEPLVEMVGKMAIPAVAGAALSAAVPTLAPGIIGNAVTGAIGGAVGGVGTTAVSNLMEGDPLLKDVTLGSLGRDALIGGATGAALPVVARGVRSAGASLLSRLPRRTDPVSSLAGFDEAMSMRAPLSAVEPMPALMHDQPGMTVARDDLDTGIWGGLRSEASSPKWLLERSADSQGANIAGRRIAGMNNDARALRSAAHYTRLDTGVAALPPDQRRAVTVALGGRYNDLPPQYQTPEILDAATRARANFYDAASDTLTENRAATIVTTGPDRGRAVPYQPRQDYVPWIPAEPRGAGARLRQILSNRGRTPQTMFQRTGDRGPVEQALDELWGIEGPQPTNWVTDADEAMRVYIDGGGSRIGYPELVARSRHFGPITEQHPDAEHPWGQDANVLYQQMLEARAPREAEAFRNTMEPIYRPNKPTGGDRAATWLKDRISHMTLGQTALTQLPQGSTPMWRFGLGNDLRGKYDYITDPSFRDLTRISGAPDAGFAREMGTESIHRRATQSVEEALRGFGNAGAKPYAEQLAERVRTGNVNAATRKQLAELEVMPADLENGLDAPTLKHVLNTSAHKNQYHPYEPGESGAYFLTPKGKLLTMYQPFGHASWRNFQSDVLEPLLGPQGWREAYNTGDYSLQGLGAARAGRMALYGLPAAAGTEVLKSAVGLREFDPLRVADAFLSTNTGTPGMMLTSAMQGYKPDEVVTRYPAASLLGSTTDNLMNGRVDRVLMDAAAALDPSGTAAVLRPTYYNLTR